MTDTINQPEKRCQNPKCNNPFVPTREWQECCSSRCRTEYHAVARYLGYRLLKDGTTYSQKNGGFFVDIINPVCMSCEGHEIRAVSDYENEECRNCPNSSGAFVVDDLKV